MLHDLTEIYALHCDPRTDVGQIALKVGPITSAVDQVNIVLSGSGGHTSRPQLTQDVIGALGALATMTQLLLSRRIDPRSGVSLMWGSMHAGSVANAIPRTGEIVGTLRALDADGWHWPSNSSLNWLRRSSGRSESRWRSRSPTGCRRR